MPTRSRQRNKNPTQPTPANVFLYGGYGLWCDATDTGTLYQDSTATTPIGPPGNPVGFMHDKSGNNTHLIQPTTSLKPIYQTAPARIVYDLFDDKLDTTYTQTIAATMLMGTTLGTIHCEIGVNAGSWTLPIAPYGLAGEDFIQVIIRDPVLIQSELDFCKFYLQDYGSDTVFTPITLLSYFNQRTDITKIYLDNWDTAAVTDFSYCFYNCVSLQELDVSALDTTSGVNFEAMLSGLINVASLDISTMSFANATSLINFVRGNTSLTSITVGNAFDNSNCVTYTSAFRDCSLNQQSVDDILVSINAAGTSNGTLGIQGSTNAPPGAIGKAATDALRSRGWTVTLNGY